MPQYGKRWVKTEARKAEKVAFAAEMGRLKAIQKFERKEKLTDQLREYIKKWLDKIDPIELAAITGATIIVHDVLFKADEFIRQVEVWKQSEKIQTKIIASGGIFGFEGGIALEIVKAIFPDLFQKAYGDKPEVEQRTLTGELTLWFVAFAIAYYGIKHGADLLNVARMFFGGIT